jgi:hypothetical protein
VLFRKSIRSENTGRTRHDRKYKEMVFGLFRLSDMLLVTNVEVTCTVESYRKWRSNETPEGRDVN